MRYYKLLATMIIVSGILFGCSDENDEKEVNSRKYVMSIKASGDLIQDNKIIGSIVSPSDTVDHYLNSEESFVMFVPDTLYLLENNVAKIKFANKRQISEETTTYLNSLNLKYTETNNAISVFSDIERGAITFTKVAGKVFIGAELGNIYKHQQIFSIHYRFTSIQEQKYGIGKWPTYVTETDTIQYYSIKFEYN